MLKEIVFIYKRWVCFTKSHWLEYSKIYTLKFIPLQKNAISILTFFTSKRFLLLAVEVEGWRTASRSIFSWAAAMFVSDVVLNFRAPVRQSGIWGEVNLIWLILHVIKYNITITVSPILGRQDVAFLQQKFAPF